MVALTVMLVEQVRTSGAQDAGLTVTVKVQNRLGSPTFAAGESIALSWAPAETRLFPRERAGA